MVLTSVATLASSNSNKSLSQALKEISVGEWIGLILSFLRGVAIASLSYAKYRSILWAIVDFFFCDFYIIYYAFFLNTPVVGGRK